MRNEVLQELVFSILMGRMQSDRRAVTRISEELLQSLFREASKTFSEEDIALRLSGEYVVVGDIHGNIDDLIRIFERFNYPPEANYLFLGDYVDRGEYSIEVLVMLYSLKLLYPNNIYLIRGNHESDLPSRSYGFKHQCKKLFSSHLYSCALESFSNLPICAILNDNVFCVHGGMTPDIESIEQISKIERPIMNVEKSAVSGLLWSDPSASTKEYTSSPRGVGSLFGGEPLSRFLDENGLAMMIRAHKYCNEGFNWPFKTEGDCLTIFSTSNYVGKRNRGAVALVDENSNVKIRTYPYLLEEQANRRRIQIPVQFSPFVEVSRPPIDELFECELPVYSAIF